ncbi:MAG: aromatic ring-hydroxylating dioxygenase subunit alpha [Alphaproteobacteria bacterium]|nr:aromatic ring-hydroxylating dioxygenase subunit alpha [Alphaproteobacteria bacterium]|tara:strand:+ start:7 stop:1365 length:1359 start_codon:yes stop_codon:yes gene_type:complete
MSDLNLQDLVRTDEGLISRRIFFDPDIYRAELENIFAKCWLYLAHESQLPNPGDYTTNYMGEDPVLIWRGMDGEIRAFLNSCRHRGMRVCRTDSGNAHQFACPFHGWTYGNNGELKTVPNFEDGYFGDLDKENWGLHEVPCLTSYGGFIFGNWDADAESLDGYLGDLRWYLDILITRSLGGVEVIPGQQRYSVAGNWKIAAENFVGDSYHLAHSHGSAYALPIRQLNPANPMVFRDRKLEYYDIAMEGGHGFTQFTLSGERVEVDRMLAEEMGSEVVEYVEECHARLVKLSEAQAKVHALPFGNVFPNFSINDFSALRPVGLYLWTPKGPGNLEVWQWAATDRDAPQVIKDMARIDFTRFQSTSGIVGPDDTENFEQVTQSTAGVIGQRLDFNYQMTLERELVEGFDDAPGYISTYVSEENQRLFYQHWANLMDGGRGARQVYDKPRLAAQG